jgi:hypothetical protein
MHKELMHFLRKKIFKWLYKKRNKKLLNSNFQKSEAPRPPDWQLFSKKKKSCP